MTAKNLRFGKFVLAAGLLLAASGASISGAEAAAQDYRFELVGKPTPSAGKDVVQVRLVHAADGKPMPDAVIIESTADMTTSGMGTMPGMAMNGEMQGKMARMMDKCDRMMTSMMQHKDGAPADKS